MSPHDIPGASAVTISGCLTGLPPWLPRAASGEVRSEAPLATQVLSSGDLASFLQKAGTMGLSSRRSGVSMGFLERFRSLQGRSMTEAITPKHESAWPGPQITQNPISWDPQDRGNAQNKDALE